MIFIKKIMSNFQKLDLEKGQKRVNFYEKRSKKGQNYTVFDNICHHKKVK